jgi:hypothetical protein
LRANPVMSDWTAGGAGALLDASLGGSASGASRRPKDFTTVMAASAMKAMATSKVAMSAVVSFGGAPGAGLGVGGARGLSPPRDAWALRCVPVPYHCSP